MTAFLHSQILIFIPVRKTYMNIYRQVKRLYKVDL